MSDWRAAFPSVAILDCLSHPNLVPRTQLQSVMRLHATQSEALSTLPFDLERSLDSSRGSDPRHERNA